MAIPVIFSGVRKQGFSNQGSWMLDMHHLRHFHHFWHFQEPFFFCGQNVKWPVSPFSPEPLFLEGAMPRSPNIPVCVLPNYSPVVPATDRAKGAEKVVRKRERERDTHTHTHTHTKKKNTHTHAHTHTHTPHTYTLVVKMIACNYFCFR